MNESGPSYVTGSCQHCNGNIKFDANLPEQWETRSVPCPNCGKETLVHAPPSVATEADPDDDQEVKLLLVRWYRKAAEQGDAYYQLMLGQALADGILGPQDLAEAAQWFCKSAEQGNANAQFNLGVCYWNGHGIEEDRTEAVKWLRKAADQGDRHGQFALGVAYFTGDGASQDHAEAAVYSVRPPNRDTPRHNSI